MVDDNFTSVLLNCLSFAVGDGTSIFFWHDKWVENGCLKDLFPSLFVLPSQPLGFISDYRACKEGSWQWRLCWYQDLTSSKLDQL